MSDNFDEKFERALAATGRPHDYRPAGRYGLAGMKRYSAMEKVSRHPDAVYVDDMLSRMSPSKVAEVLGDLLAHKGLTGRFFVSAAKKTVKFSMNQGTALKPHWVALTRAEARDQLAEVGIAF